MARYNYTAINEDGSEGTKYSDFNEIPINAIIGDYGHIKATRAEDNTVAGALVIRDDYEAWREMLDRCHWAPKSEVATAVDPKHYKGYVEEFQWIDTMSRIPTLKDPKIFSGAVEMQIRKYLDRNGQKDDVIQELLKARWYLNYLIAYKVADRPIMVDEVEDIISSI
jgi:hypothetical protein